MTRTAREEVKARGRQAAQGDWFERFARAGLIAKGSLYLAYGLVALEVLRSVGLDGGGGQGGGSRGALSTIAQQPLGTFLLWCLAVGFLGYAVWRALQAVRGPHDESGGKAAAMRVAFAVRALTYLGLCVLTVRQVLTGGSSSGGGTQQATATVLGLPFGVPLVLAFAAVLAGIAVYQAKEGVTKDFLEPLRLGQLSERQRVWFTRAGVVGHVARALVFGAVAVFLAQAALTYNPDQAVGLDGALGRLAGAPYGPYLLGFAAVGLAAYALWCWVLARYANTRQVD